MPVVKAKGAIRICGDYKPTLNPNLVVDDHPLPTINEFFTNMSGGQKFSKIDVQQAYLHLEIHSDDREYLTLNTPIGLLQPTRLMYGVASAPAIWQKTMEQMLQGIEGLAIFFDDITVTAPDDATHIKRLSEAFERFHKFNVRINFEKCTFLANEITCCGYRITKDGVSKSPLKVKEIDSISRPENKQELRVLTWYDPKLPLVLATNSSQFAVGAVLSHLLPDASERPIQFASQTLSKTQREYSNIDREAYVTDHQPLTQIFGSHKGLPIYSASRMQHYAIYLQAFNYTIKYRHTTKHANADAMSRLIQSKEAPQSILEECNVFYIQQIETLPLTVNSLAKATAIDKELVTLLMALKTGEVIPAASRFNIDQNEFGLVEGCIMRGIRVVVPQALRKVIREIGENTEREIKEDEFIVTPPKISSPTNSKTNRYNKSATNAESRAATAARPTTNQQPMPSPELPPQQDPSTSHPEPSQIPGSSSIVRKSGRVIKKPNRLDLTWKFKYSEKIR
ncbi:RNase H-like domain found in reverse transcriptase [Popillia japonica]|uniref:RNase H-like domain found in reverse transcriptase n=1 Tax=Popillia japonica TaxID=7064 RepID=A0AAW1L7K8_POPJA